MPPPNNGIFRNAEQLVEVFRTGRNVPGYNLFAVFCGPLAAASVDLFIFIKSAAKTVISLFERAPGPIRRIYNSQVKILVRVFRELFHTVRIK